MVHVGEGTLSKRVDEFSETSVGALTVQEFDAATKAADEAQVSAQVSGAHLLWCTAPGVECLNTRCGMPEHTSAVVARALQRRAAGAWVQAPVACAHLHPTGAAPLPGSTGNLGGTDGQA